MSFGRRALAAEDDAAVDLVIETRLALLDQPEFRDPLRVITSYSIHYTKLYEAGSAYRRVVEMSEPIAQAELERITALLSERVDGRTLPEVREALAREAEALRHQANRLLELAVSFGRRALAAEDDAAVDRNNFV